MALESREGTRASRRVEKNHVVPPSSKDEALARYSVSREVPRSVLIISWPQSPPAVILEPKKIKSLTVSIVSPSICHEVDRKSVV